VINGFKLKNERFGLMLGGKIFIQREVKQQDRLPKEAMDALSLKASGSVPGEKPNVDLAHGLILSQVLESCMKSCGKRFHDEVGKFRFLNELIKVVSPKVGPRGSSWR